MTSKLTWSPPVVPARLPGWETAYARVLESHLANAFAWGTSDCLILPADLCLAMTGVEVFPAELRRYDSEIGALKLLSKLGLGGVEDALRRAFPPVPVARARRGDCGVRTVTIDGRATASAFVVLGNGMAVGKAEGRGKVIVPVFELTSAFAIGALR